MTISYCHAVDIADYIIDQQFYDMYLDDGVSRDSAPVSCFAKTSGLDSKSNTALVADEEARGFYRRVRITHVG